ncbi:uncharacterized protein LOC116195824 [Punica granatum]|uniref:CUE domain-containing protein n=2 Tax=Punica granatum TaxID=22663 RepID=A0A218WHD2_PUNGR|nr:uncharacterized protein LOC116195824 [Punica granatum]OWM71770.1 hypothetical protein CDL15_Pgr005958 [Punica granatum]PKI52568.1 hypothetical protein CRG98_027040 [Punica granatum]
MSAILCGKRSIFEELSAAAAPSKRIRCSSSPVRFSPPTQPFFDHSSSSPSRSALLIDQLFSIFPNMDKQLLGRALAECGDDLDLAIRSLNKLRLESAQNDLASADDKSDVASEANVQTQGDASSLAQENVPADGAEWVKLFVGEMMSAANVDDAKARASRALGMLEKSIFARAQAEAQTFLQEDRMLKQQVETLIQENAILKRAVSIQHERKKEYDDRSQELENLKQLISQYQEQLRTLEVNNYALTMHLKQAQQSSSIPGRFHPDVF